HSDDGLGQLVGAGFERTGGDLTFAGNGQWATNRFREVGTNANDLRRARQTTLSVGYNLGVLGSVSVTHVVQDLRGQPNAEVVTLFYNVQMGRSASFNLSLQRIPGPFGSTGM